MTIEQLYEIYKQSSSVQTDSRKVQPGDLFFALKGENFNGNQFAKQALDSGASFCIIDEQQYDIPGKTILVDNALLCLQKLAGYHRGTFESAEKNIPFLAITGSNGKTTTKELVHAVLSTTFTTYTTEGNLNNHIGIPLTLLKIKPDAEIAVIEMGANHQREIAGYCEYARPTHGLITNCGKAHLEGFGGVEGVKKGKGELYDYIRSSGGTVFLMKDYDYLNEMSKGISHIVTYGTSNAAIEGHVYKNEPFLEVNISNEPGIGIISTQLVGDYNLSNVLAAVAIGKYFNVPDARINAAISNYSPSNSRSQLIRKGSNSYILDAYNANPSSMKPAIENFAGLAATDKVLVLGAMAELGDESPEEHRKIIELIKQYDWKNVLLVGGEFLKQPHPFVSFENASQAKEWMSGQQFRNTHFLVKGSRSMKMEQVIE